MIRLTKPVEIYLFLWLINKDQSKSVLSRITPEGAIFCVVSVPYTCIVDKILFERLDREVTCVVVGYIVDHNCGVGQTGSGLCLVVVGYIMSISCRHASILTCCSPFGVALYSNIFFVFVCFRFQHPSSMSWDTMLPLF